jgi:hypothetical protein
MTSKRLKGNREDPVDSCGGGDDGEVRSSGVNTVFKQCGIRKKSPQTDGCFFFIEIT